MIIQPAGLKAPPLTRTGPIWKEVVKRVRCPYPGCRVGGAWFKFKQAINGPQVEMPMEVVLECDTCKHPKTGQPNRYRVAMQVKLIGVGLDHEAGRIPK